MESPTVDTHEELVAAVEPEDVLPPALIAAGVLAYEELLVEEISIDGMCGVY